MSDAFLIEYPNISLGYDSSFFPSAIRKPSRPLSPIHPRLLTSPWIDSVFIFSKAVFDWFVCLISLSGAPNETENLIPIYLLPIVVDGSITNPGQGFRHPHDVDKLVRLNVNKVPSFLILQRGLG